MLSLEFITSKIVFYKCLNNFNSDGHYYCCCDSFSGCENYIGHKFYCFVCRINDTYCSYDFEETKYQPAKLIKLAMEFFEDFRLCYEFDETLVFWNKDYEYKRETFL